MNVRSARNWALPLRALPLILCLAHSAVIYRIHTLSYYFSVSHQIHILRQLFRKGFYIFIYTEKIRFFSCLQIMQSHKSFVYIHFRIIQFSVSHQIHIFETAIQKGILYLYLYRKNSCFSQWQIMQFYHLQGLNSRNCTQYSNSMFPYNLYLIFQH